VPSEIRRASELHTIASAEGRGPSVCEPRRADRNGGRSGQHRRPAVAEDMLGQHVHSCGPARIDNKALPCHRTRRSNVVECKRKHACCYVVQVNVLGRCTERHETGPWQAKHVRHAARRRRAAPTRTCAALRGAVSPPQGAFPYSCAIARVVRHSAAIAWREIQRRRSCGASGGTLRPKARLSGA